MTSKHEFFGISLMESMYCGVVPVVPRALVYKEHFSNVEYPFLYRQGAKGELVKMVRELVMKSESEMNELRTVCRQVSIQYNAVKICKRYDEMLASC